MKPAFARNSQPLRHSVEQVFHIQLSICGVNFSSDMSVPRASVGTRETELDTAFETS